MKDCAIERWLHERDPQDDHVVRETVIIRDGAIVADGDEHKQGGISGEEVEEEETD